MKKTLVISVLAIACAVVFNSQNVYASSHKKTKHPGSIMTQAVHQDFPQVKGVSWEEHGRHFVAFFNSDQRKITAIFSNRGKLLSTLILDDDKDIPFVIKTHLTKKYPDYAVQCMKEFINKEGDSYFFILKEQKGNLVTWLRIKSNTQGDFDLLNKLSQKI